MKIFIDTANVKEISQFANLGIIEGVTTNPTLIAQEGNDLKKQIQSICQITNGPVSVEVLGGTQEAMLKEAKLYASIASNVVIKIPVTPVGLQVINILSKNKIKTNATLVFNEAQALLAARAGATYVSLFVGRLYDHKINGMLVAKNIAKILSDYKLSTKLIAASIRNPEQASMAAISGVDYSTIPPKVLIKMIDHPLTREGIEKFNQDYEAVFKKD